MITIERARKEDAEKITAIKTAAFNQEINTYLGRNGGPPGYNEVESELDIIQRFLAYKIMLNGEIIGSLFLYPEEDDVMHFEDFVIDPVHQGNGFGYQVMEMIQNQYPSIREWRLSTPVFSVGNQHLYERFGYREVHRDNDEIYYHKTVSIQSDNGCGLPSQGSPN